MESTFAVIKQDLQAAINAVEGDDLSFVTIIGNRIMTNIFITGINDLMILGWMVRELGGELGFIKSKKESKKESKESEMSHIKAISKSYLEELRDEIAKGNNDPKFYYNKYISTEDELRQHFLTDYENTSYDNQEEFSKQFAIQMIDLFYNNRNNMFVKNNNFIQSIAGELSRNYNEHGGDIALAAYFIFKALDTYYRYAYIELFYNEDEDIIKETKAKLDNYVDEIYKLKSILIDGTVETYYNNMNIIISRLGADFRLYYIKYSDIADIQIRIRENVRKEKINLYPESEEKITLSPESKQKIGDILTQTLQMRVNPRKDN